MILLKLLLSFVLISCIGLNSYCLGQRKIAAFSTSVGQLLRQRLLQNRRRKPQRVCYGDIGCFNMHKISPLQKLPESPSVVDTKFYLFTRNNSFSHPEVLLYENNGKSLNESKFSANNPVKIIIHGYLSRWNVSGLLEGVKSYLALHNCNTILLDWNKGANGQYATAAANTELVGRQLGMLLLQMIDKGMKPEAIHLLGFSLGAHIAGCASEYLKTKGHLIGRITGLDPASPLFKFHRVKEKSKKLDRYDARFVDVLHTDASPFITDGFGILEPIGHVDFFPNGGFQQPGCTDAPASAVVSHLNKSLSAEIACSHIRAWSLFRESLQTSPSDKKQCEFVAYKCKDGFETFEDGECFPQILGSSLENYRNDIGRLGEHVKGEGVMYLMTRGSPPFCGTQLQASVHISEKTQPTKGILQIHVHYDKNQTTDFKIKCIVQPNRSAPIVLKALAVASFDNWQPDIKNMSAIVRYAHNSEDNRTTTGNFYIDGVHLRDMYGHSWHYCKKNTPMKKKNGKNFEMVKITMKQETC